MNGLTFNGKHSYKDFGLTMYSKNRPILPESKIIVEEITGRDGDYDYSEVNPDKRTKYQNRTHEIEFSLKEKNVKILRIRAHQIASWLACGEKQLIYDDETAVFYLAKVINKLDLENQIVSLKRFTLQFRCRPFAFSAVKSNEQIQFGQGLMFGYGYKLDMIPTRFVITGSTALNVYNPGTYVKPLIRLTGSFTTISLTANGKTLTYNTPIASAKVEIDCDKMKAIKDDAINVLNNVAGDFMEFINGDNTLQISGDGLACTVELIFNYLYL